MLTTRFAPSPTGFLHIGSLRTALYSYLFAKQNKGKFILRIEDTDQKRYVEGATESLIHTLSWFGLDYDEGPELIDGKIIEKGENGPYFQSARTAIYKKYAEELLEKGHAYRCFCTAERLEQMRTDQTAKKLAPMYDRACLYLSPEEIEKKMKNGEKYVIRQKMSYEQKITFEDTIRGHMEFDSKNIDDQVLIKSDGFPTYHLANVVDDHLMGVTHVIRGEEWLPSTPKHIALYQALGWQHPIFAHLPLLLNPDKTKLSKRQGDVAAEDYIKKGYLKEAIINFIALLGWNPGTTEEFFTLRDLIEKFSIERVQKAGAVFNLEKLNWLNAHYIRQKSPEELAKLITPTLPDWFEKSPYKNNKYLLKTIKIIQTRLETLAQASELLKFFFVPEVEFNHDLLLNEKMKVDAPTAKLVLEESLRALKALPENDFETEEKIKTSLMEVIQKLNLKNGQVLWPLRVALTGEQYSPGAFEVISGLGKEISLKRIQTYIDKLV
ncbi:MAG: glutamate--tRNA ligase [Candidatus Gracilibacteria bacterium]